jgi:hypothetical protein
MLIQKMIVKYFWGAIKIIEFYRDSIDGKEEFFQYLPLDYLEN